MNRRDFLRMVAGAATVRPRLLSSGEAPPRGRRPNILFVFPDQMRRHAMGCSGNEQVRTPNLDKLASDGVYFSNCIANCPVCTPDRAILLTGKYPLSNGTIVNDLPLLESQTTVAELLGEAGYKAGYIGKWHLDGIPRSKFTPPGLRRQGFDAYWAAYNCHHQYFNTKYYLDTPDLVRAEGYEPDVQTDLAIDFIRRRRQEPFFLFLSWGPPHAPYRVVPQKYLDMYNPASLQLRPNCRNAERQAIAGYYAHITALDDDVGRLMQVLDELQIAENTLVVFTSDHGDMLWSQGRVKKQQPWEECINVPLLIRHPKVLKPRRTDLLIGLADLAPTLLSLAGVPVLDSMEGLDLSRAIRGESGPRHDSVPIMDILPADQASAWGGKEWRGIRTLRHTYARWRDEGWVLYDNVEDPFQQNNLINDSAHKKLRGTLEDKLQAWLKKLGDRFLPGEEHLKQLGLLEAWMDRQRHFREGGNW
jgi:arylsulfatase A-like enzyme